MVDVSFVVLHAGCEACAVRVGRALEPIATVRSIEVDEEADVAIVRLVGSSGAAEDEVARALREASVGSGHEYGIREGSWAEASHEHH